mmetsp:Transcript_18338/g.31358  ORF Transcript_18338/g.31358 Transcript_18338/m.31358 type:complete len:137 (-) Transcript_18338:1332-1742(-)
MYDLRCQSESVHHHRNSLLGEGGRAARGAAAQEGFNCCGAMNSNHHVNCSKGSLPTEPQPPSFLLDLPSSLSVQKRKMLQMHTQQLQQSAQKLLFPTPATLIVDPQDHQAQSTLVIKGDLDKKISAEANSGPIQFS